MSEIDDTPTQSTRIIKPQTTTTTTPRPTTATSSLRNLTPILLDQMLNSNHHQIFQIDLHRLLCFSSNHRLLLDCCQCLLDQPFPASSGDSSSSSFNYFGSATSNTWLSKYCGYYFLMVTTAQARSNNSLLVKYLNNMRSASTTLANPTSDNDNSNKNANFTQVLINNINYFILNEWLDNQTQSANLNSVVGDNGKRNHFAQIQSKGFQNNSITSKNNITTATTNTNSTTSTTSSNTVTTETTIVVTEKATTKTMTQSSVDLKQAQIIEEKPDSEVVATTSNPTNSTLNKIRSDSKTSLSDTSIASTTSTTTPVVDEDSTRSSSTVTVSTTTVAAEAVNSADQATATTTLPPTASTTTSSMATPHHPTPSVPTPIVIASGKDAVFMRLNNRIKILELNMSLSSQYLEKLSQHYRKQMDEMQRAFNLTTTALIDTIRIADERDVKQNEKIILMEKRVEKMQQSIDSLNILLNDLRFQVFLILKLIIFPYRNRNIKYK